MSDTPKHKAPAEPKGAVPSRAADTVAVVDANGLEHELTLAVWNELGPIAQEAFTLKAAKPAELG